jgi:hypothetical protein
MKVCLCSYLILVILVSIVSFIPNMVAQKTLTESFEYQLNFLTELNYVVSSLMQF